MHVASRETWPQWLLLLQQGECGVGSIKGVTARESRTWVACRGRTGMQCHTWSPVCRLCEIMVCWQLPACSVVSIAWSNHCACVVCRPQLVL